MNIIQKGVTMARTGGSYYAMNISPDKDSGSGRQKMLSERKLIALQIFHNIASDSNMFSVFGRHPSERQIVTLNLRPYNCFCC